MIAVCADDFGLTQKINQSILELASASKVTHVSCITVYPEFSQDSELLCNIPGLKLGLHTCLTKNSTWLEFLRKYYLGDISAEAIRSEIFKQLETFEKVIGKLPEYVDSHHHIHQTPLIADLFLNCMSSLPRTTNIRCTSKFHPLSSSGSVRNWTFNQIGEKFKRKLLAHGFNTNDTYWGSLNSACDMNKLSTLSFDDNLIHLVVTHPGKKEDSLLEQRDQNTFDRGLDVQFLNKLSEVILHLPCSSSLASKALHLHTAQNDFL